MQRAEAWKSQFIQNVKLNETQPGKSFEEGTLDAKLHFGIILKHQYKTLKLALHYPSLKLPVLYTYQD